MEEQGVTEDEVKAMEVADEPDMENACFFGCMMIKEQFVRLISKNVSKIRRMIELFIGDR